MVEKKGRVKNSILFVINKENAYFYAFFAITFLFINNIIVPAIIKIPGSIKPTFIKQLVELGLDSILWKNVSTPLDKPRIIVKFVSILLSLFIINIDSVIVAKNSSSTNNNPTDNSKISLPNVSSKKLYDIVFPSTFKYTDGSIKDKKANKQKK